MTTRNQEIYDTFQLFYDNVSSNQAPGLTLQEISTYLSDAQNALVQSFYQEYEKDEAARKALVPLVRTALIDAESSSGIEKIATESKFYKLPVITLRNGEEREASESDNDTTVITELPAVLYVLYECVRGGTNTSCPKNQDVLIQPVTHDEFHGIYRNPFRYNSRRALRLDVSDGTYNYAEIVSKTSGQYYMRYIERPTPILLSGGDYEIDGYNTEHEPVLDHIFDNTIVEAAAMKAYQHYKS